MYTRFVSFVLLVIAWKVSYSQGSAMPSNFPSLTPLRGANINKGVLGGLGVQYNDGSYMSEKTGDIKGTPLLFENWNIGSVWMHSKEHFDSLLLKYDQMNDLLFVKIDGMEYQFNPEVDAFQIRDSATQKLFLFRNGFSPVSTFDQHNFYQVLYNGKIKLLFKNKKQVVSSITSTPGVREKSFEDQKSYFLVLPSGEVRKIKKKNTGVLDLLDDPNGQLSTMIKANKLKLNNDEEIIQLLQYYDSLKK